MTEKQLQNGNKIKQAVLAVLDKKGISRDKLEFIMCQVGVETANYQSPLLEKANNASGIVWFHQPNAHDSGIHKPAGEAPGTYAGYDTLEQWAEDYLHIITKKVNPLSATTIEEYAKLLKENGYYEASEADYVKGLNSFLPEYKKYFNLSV